MPSEIILVTPVWKDSARLAEFGRTLARQLAASSLPIRWIIADDGSDSPQELQRLIQLKTEFFQIFPRVDLHCAAQHRGKGSVVREAWALAPHAGWFAFVDADGSVKAQDFLKLIEHALAAGQSVLAIRKNTADTQIIESPWRGLAHRVFLLLARLMLGLRCADLQCGAKIFKGEDYRKIAHLLRQDGLAFDSELLVALKNSGAHWLEQPVSWTEKKGGAVKPWRDAWRMLAALIEIRSRYKS